MSILGINKNLIVTTIISLGIHLAIIFVALPDFSIQAGQEGERKLIVSFGTIELPEIVTEERDTQEPIPEQVESPSATPPGKDSLTGPPQPRKLPEETRAVLMPSNPNPGTPALTKGQIDNIKSRFLRQVIARIQQVKRYPRIAKRRNLEGRVKVEFVLSKSGKLLSVRILNSSGHTVLDKEAVAMIKRVKSFPPIPEELNMSKITIPLPIIFRLEEKR